MKIVSKILLLVSLSIALVMAGGSYLSIHQTQGVVHKQIDRLLTTNLEFAKTEILETTENIKRTTEIVAHNPAIAKSLFLQLSRGINQILNEMVAIYPFYNYVMIVESNGDIFAASTKDSQGHKIAGEQLLGLNFRENPLFSEPSPNETTIGNPGSDPFLSLIEMERGMSQWFITPVRKRGELIGWVVVSYDWQNELSALLVKITQRLIAVGNPTTEAILTDENGNIVVGGKPTEKKFVPSPDRLWKENQLTFGKTTMRVIIANDRTKTNQPVIKTRNLLLSIIISSTLLLVVLLYVILKKTLLQRLEALHVGTRELGKGNLAYRLPPLGHDEVGELAETFNQMGENLNEANKESQEKIEYLDNIPTPVLFIDKDFSIRFINRAGAGVVDKAVDECISMKCYELFNTEHCHTEKCRIAMAMKLDKVLTGDTTAHFPNDELPIRYTGAPLKDEAGNVIGAIEYIVDTTDEMKVIDISERISQGDYSVEVEKRSEEDRLSVALNRMTKNLRAVVKQAQSIAIGDFSTEIQPRSQKDELGTALREMNRSLREMTGENERQSLLKTGQMELNNTMRGEQDISTLVTNIISYLCDYLGAKIGAFYVVDEEDVLRLAGSYAYQKRKSLSNEFRLGEGVVGQAALEKQRILVTHVPVDYIRIQSGLGEAVPQNILVLPFLLDDKVKGVVELGAFHEFTDLNLAFLDQVAENIAVAVNSAQSRTRMAALLEQTQKQAEELQAQQEELRVSNEELEEQTKALKESEARLQAQQEELEETNEELEEKTQILEKQKEDIQRKKDELEKAHRLIKEKATDLEMTGKYKSEFLANMSHELRTPLNSILLLSRLLSDNKDGTLTEKQMEFAKTINSSGSDLLALLNEILDLSKVEAGKIEVHVEEVNLNDFAVNMERNYRPAAQEKGLSLNIGLADGLPGHIRTDRQRIEQIVKNFLSNAFKFTSRGGVTLKIDRPDDQIDLSKSGLVPKKTIAFSVVDTGQGIPKDKRKLIFEAFQQADGTTSRKFGGTGLGLSISRELARLLGGEIQLESEEGKGSTFTLYLPETLEEESEAPRFIPDDSSKAADIPPSPAERSNGQTGQRVDRTKSESPKPPTDLEVIRDDQRKLSAGEKSILIIEDDPKFAKILRDLSREKGFKALVAGDGETGLHFSDYYKPSAIILDIGLPGMDGWAVMSRLKENPETRHIPVHFISASEKSLDATKMGAVSYLTKPVSMEGLEQVFGKIKNLISKPTKNLLVVEGDEAQRKAIVELIGDGDVLITAVSTGQEADDLLKSGKFHCMILDLRLPDMSGVELLSKIRNDEDLLHIPIIIYTGKDLTRQEEITINEYAESMIIKGARSPERLLDETTLFLHRVEANLPEEKRHMLRMIHDKESIMKDKKILLVDDDMRNVFALTNIIEEKVAKILVGKDGKEGLECLENNPDVDLVLMDIMMPEMDGYAAIREIRKQERFRKLPIIALTAKAMKGDRNRCIEAGANDYLAKPVDTDKLLSMLRVWLY